LHAKIYVQSWVGMLDKLITYEKGTMFISNGFLSCI